MSKAELVALLAEVYAAMQAEVTERDGADPFGVHSCSRCQARLDVHSLGCRISTALQSTEVES